MKTCPKCGTPKKDIEFSRRLGKLKSWCKQCECEDARMRRLKNPEKARREDREWYARNLNTVRMKNREKYFRRRALAIEANRRWKLENPDHIARAAALRRLRAYGITQEKFQKLLDSQLGKCAICSGLLDSKSKNMTPCVDHNHSTGQVRGILCKLCNVGLGNFLELSERLIFAAEYLKKHS